MNTSRSKTIAIIGCGPRGLNALENLLIEYIKSKQIFDLKVLVFERTGLFGCGQVYAPMQTKHNWMNLCDRNLTLDARPELYLKEQLVTGFPSYHDWKGCDFSDKSKMDTYPTRAEVGRYLKSRFESMATSLENMGWLTCIPKLVEDVSVEDIGFIIKDESGKLYKSDDVVLTLGHQLTELSKQLAQWKSETSRYSNLTLIERAYPLRELAEELQLTNETNVAIRGFGLAMIDIARAIAGMTNSTFRLTNPETQEVDFIPGENFPKTLIPFSLDGLPMHPKPLNQDIDDCFKPSESELSKLKETLSALLKQPERIRDLMFLKSEMAAIIATLFLRLKDKAIDHRTSKTEIKNVIISYFEGDSPSSSLIISEDLSVKEQLERYCAMATATGKISLDYCIGQVWRHCHPTLYECLSFTGLTPELISELIQLDERLKRLTFGPPVASLQQLVAMIKAGKLTIKVLDDPDIVVSEHGWYLEENNDRFCAQVMINSVLDGTTITKVETPLIERLLEKGYLQPIHPQLGVETFANGIVKPKSQCPEVSLALLGRLAQGTLLGVDAILECFGQRSKHWAKGFVERLKTK